MEINIDVQTFVDSYQQPFLIIDKNFRIVAVNSAYEKAYGAKRDIIVGQPCYQASHGNDGPCFENGEDCPYRQVFGDERPHSCCHTHYDDNGRSHLVRVSALPLKSANGELYLGTIIEEVLVQDEPTDDTVQMVGESKLFVEAVEQMLLAARSDEAVLVQGETGTGKELAAGFIHEHSARRGGPFFTLDCTAIPEALFESEVFGYERGAFTGSTGDKPGLFELCNGGTLLLDEIGDMPPALQAKLLRVLDTGKFRRLGGRKILHADVRIVCATNQTLRGAEGFRQDLYYRIACLTVQLPSLRERVDDIPVLARTLLRGISASTRKSCRLTADAIEQLQQYHYPGNVRELRNILVALSANCPNGRINSSQVARDLPKTTDVPSPPSERRPAILAPPFLSSDPRNVQTLSELERQHLAHLLEEHAGSRQKTAAALGISERTLYRKLKRHELHGTNNTRASKPVIYKGTLTSS